MAYTSAWNTMVISQGLYNIQMPLHLFFHLSWTHPCTKLVPHFCWAKTCFPILLSGNVTKNILLSAYLDVILLVLICGNISFPVSQYIFACICHTDMGLHYLLQLSVFIPTQALASMLMWRRGSPRRTSVAGIGAVLTAPVIPRLAYLCTLLRSALLVLYFTLGHHTVVPYVIIGHTTIVYVHYSAFSFSPKCFQKCLYGSKMPCRSYL
jgi:hypothetical protein